MRRFSAIVATALSSANAPFGRVLSILAGFLTFISLLWITGCEIQTNITPMGGYDGTSDAAVAPNSRFVITWYDSFYPPPVTCMPESESVICGSQSILARAYDQTGSPVTGEIDVAYPSNNTPYLSVYPDVPRAAIDNAGDFVIVYSAFWSITNSYAIFVQEYDASGLSFPANPVDFGVVSGFDVAMDPVSGDYDISYVKEGPKRLAQTPFT